MFYLCVGSTFPIPRHLTPRDAADSHKLNLKQMVNLWTYSLHSQTTGTNLIFRLAESQQMQLNFFEHALGFPRLLWSICGHAHGHGYTTLSLSLAHFNYPNYYIINGKILSKLHSCPFWPSSFFFCLQVRSNPVSNPETLFSVSLFVLLQHLLLLLWLLPVLLLMDCLLKIILCCKTSSFLYDVVQAKHVRLGIRALMKKLVHRLLILMFSLCIVSGFVRFCFVFGFLIVHFCLILWVSVIAGE